MAVLRNGSKCIAHPAKGRDSALSPFCAPDSREFAKLNLLFLNPNLIFEIGSTERSFFHESVPSPCPVYQRLLLLSRP